ncbi:MAG TPA: alkaline phosphatase family protein [Actinomycetota bacterium]|nr:alkaline phosphatase family protein [Actinomycetota bacterium]
MADQLGAQVMTSIWRGHVPGRSGDVFLVPRPGNFVAVSKDACGVTGGAPNADTAHPMPWASLARVPLLFYGPGRVPAGRTVYTPTDLASMAPTYAKLLADTSFTADGTALPEISSGTAPPKLVVTVVVDGGGWNTLQLHPGAWPNIERLIRDGTSYANATNGSAPSITGAIHATMGTGDYPAKAGIPGNQMRGPDAKVIDTWLDRADPRFLRVPTLSDQWDLTNGNRPVVGAIAYEGWHLGFLGHGAATPGGDRDPALLWDAKAMRWWTNERDYSLPAGFRDPDLADLRSHESGLDARDGVIDGKWFSQPIESLLADPDQRVGTSAFMQFTGDAALKLLHDGRFGGDDVPDLLWLEFKGPDTAGHLWNVVSPEEGDVLSAVDEQVGRLRSALDRQVGRENYVLALTADHGQQPLPELTGGWRIDGQQLRVSIDARFGRLVQQLSATEIFLDHAAMRREGVTAEDVARFVAAQTIADNLKANRESGVAPARLGESMFAGAFSANFLESLNPSAIEAFGPSSYPEGDLTIDPPAGS